MKRVYICAGLLLWLIGATAGARAQVSSENPETGETPTAEFPVPEDALNRGTPLRSIDGFLKASDAQDYNRAAEYLDLRNLPPPVSRLGGPELARELSYVMSRAIWFDDYIISDHPDGAKGDGLPVYRDLLVDIPTPDGGKKPLWMQHVPRADGVLIWKVSNRSVALVPELYDQYSYPAFVETVRSWFPEGATFLGLEVFKWFISAAVVLLLWPVLHLIGVLLARVFSTPSSPQYPLVRKVFTRPLVALALLAIVDRVFVLLGMGPKAQAIFEARTVHTLVIVWVLWSLINLVRSHIQSRLAAQGRPGAAKLARPLATFIKLLILLMGVLFWLSNLGVNITTLLAGLGVGGLAVALALQKPLEDMMGALAIFSQAPIRVGDFCRYGNVTGTVEDIGLRTTRLRTLANTVVSIPNARIAHDEIENFTMRQKIHYAPVLRLRYDTSPGVIRDITDKLLKILQEDRRVHDTPLRVRFTNFEADALLVKVHSYLDTVDLAESLSIAEDLNLKVMDAVEACGGHFALPGRALYVEGGAFGVST